MSSKNANLPENPNDPRDIIAFAAKLLGGMSEEGRVVLCAVAALPVANYVHVDQTFSFWLTSLALGGYLTLRFVRLLPR